MTTATPNPRLSRVFFSIFHHTCLTMLSAVVLPKACQ